MGGFLTIIIAIQVISAIAIIGLVLIQQGKGADMGAAFGAGASGSVFGATGSTSFLSKVTYVAAAVFFAATLALTMMNNRGPSASSKSFMDNAEKIAPVTTETPAEKKAEIPAGEVKAKTKKDSAEQPKESGKAAEIPK